MQKQICMKLHLIFSEHFTSSIIAIGIKHSKNNKAGHQTNKAVDKIGKKWKERFLFPISYQREICFFKPLMYITFRISNMLYIQKIIIPSYICSEISPLENRIEIFAISSSDQYKPSDSITFFEKKYNFKKKFLRRTYVL